MTTRVFQTELWLPAARLELFPFFANAANLQAITPPWLHFQIVGAQPAELRVGALIDYKLRVRGVPVRWRTRITAWEPPHRFVDEQIRGPYRQWIHEHTFEECGRGTRMRDTVNYAVPMDWLLHRWFVRPDVERIFHYRAQTLQDRFRPEAVVSRLMSSPF